MTQHPLFEQPETVIDIKSRVKSLTADGFDQLKAAARFQQFIADTRWLSIVNIVVGGLNIWLGLSCCKPDFVSIYQTVGGIALIAVCLRTLFAPSAYTAFSFSIILLVFGLINIVVSIFVSSSNFGIIFGVVLLWWAYQTYRAYRNLKAHPIIKPAEEIIKLRQTITNAFRQAKFQSDADVIEFKLKRYDWVGWLLDDYAVYGSKHNKSNLFFASRSDVEFAPQDTNQLNKKRIKGVFKIDALTVWGEIRAGSLERLESWKPVEAPTADFVTTYYQSQRTALLLSKIARGVMIIFILGFVGIFVWTIWFVITYG